MELSNVDIGVDYKELGTSLDQALLDNATFVGRASGRSMEGVGIFDGDLLVINRALSVRSGDVIVAVYNGVFVCKIVDLNNNALLSASDEYPPIKIKPSDEFSLEGILTSSIRLHRSSASL